MKYIKTQLLKCNAIQRFCRFFFIGFVATIAISFAPTNHKGFEALAQKPAAANIETRLNKKEIKEKKDYSRRGKSKRSGKRGRRARGRPATVFVDTVTRGRTVETVQVYGRVVARESGVIAARSRGAVNRVLIQVGDRVKRGGIIATLVSEILLSERALKRAKVKEYKAKTKTAGVQLRLASQELERLEKLRKSSAFSVARFQDKMRDVERLKSLLSEVLARQEQSQAELRMANINLFNAKIRAPFNGVITKINVQTGAYVSVGAPVAQIINDQSLEVEAEVPANRLGGLGNSTVINVKPEFGKSFKASVRAIVPEENALSRTRVVRFTPKFISAMDTIAANQSVVLHIPSGAAKNAVTVHKDAITQRRGKRVVFLVKQEEMIVTMRRVELGEAFGVRFEVLKGLTPGDKVVIRGNERLRPRQKIRISKPGAKNQRSVWGKKGGHGLKGRKRGRGKGVKNFRSN